MQCGLLFFQTRLNYFEHKILFIQKLFVLYRIMGQHIGVCNLMKPLQRNLCLESYTYSGDDNDDQRYPVMIISLL